MAGGTEVRPASVEDPASLDRALAGAAAVINCAGPFAATVEPVVDAALRAGIPYLDITGEPRRWSPGPGADEICIAYALDGWKPTRGTRAASLASRRRRSGQRIVLAGRALELRADAAPIVEWTFPEPIGAAQVMAEFTTADSVTIPRHLTTDAIRTYMAMAAVRDLVDPSTPPPEPADEHGRSSQSFLVEVVARAGGGERRAVARGRDIYAITAPLVVEAMSRLLARQPPLTGVVSVGAVVDARDFLQALAPAHLVLELPPAGRGSPSAEIPTGSAGTSDGTRR